MSTFEIQHFKNQELAKAYMQGVHDITEWLLKPSERTATNFDRVTASPEKLVEFVTDIMFHASGCRYTGKLKCPNTTCKECVLDWLKQKAEEDD